VIFDLCTLALALAGASVPSTELASIALDVRDVALDGAPLFAGDDGRARTARLLLVWSWKESAWRTSAEGDKGASLGVMQMNRAWLGADAARVLVDRRYALERGLALMHHLAVVCGSVRGGLHAYASGTCAGSIRARELVQHRCAAAGGC
jgi:hypothetical protein